MPPKRKGSKVNVPTDTGVSRFQRLNVSDLKNECKQHGLDLTGKKIDLILRLEEYEKSNGCSLEKKVKKEEIDGEEEPVSMKDKLNELVEKERLNKKKTFQVDSWFPHLGGEIVDDYDCMLNQTNVGHNNNKFYVIQLIKVRGSFFVWNRWGRVGETGQNAIKGFGGNFEEAAVKEFRKKFKDKTKNNWDERDTFQAHPGKYTLIETEHSDEHKTCEIKESLAKLDAINQPLIDKKVKPCALDAPTQLLLKLIFDNDMFKDAMAKLNIDVKKMPLGNLSKSQIAKGFGVLEELEQAIKKKNRQNIEKFTSQFYTVIPHCFGRNRPPLIGDEETLRIKYDMLMILADIEIAQSLQNVDVKQEEEEIDHPLDVNYNLLNCGLKHIEKDCETFKMLEDYAINTGNELKLLDVWEVDRREEDRFKQEHQNIGNRKLLWHGTNIAVVVAILKSGLRIMPHSGGRVGSGIYFASENGKSSCYVGCSRDRIGIMFLNEVALGEQHVIHRDNHQLKKAPDGYHSVLAQGQQEPDPNMDVIIQIDGKDVVVPKGKPKRNPSLSSSFHQSEYLIYKESQCRIRYLLKFKF